METKPIVESKFKPEQQKAIESVVAKIDELMKTTFAEVPEPEAYTDRANIERFCIAHDFKEDVVIQKWSNWVTWRSTYKPHEISDEEDAIERQNDSGKLRWYKHDKGNRPCLYYKMRFHRPGLATVDETIRYFIFMLEKGLKKAEKLGSDKVVVIYDRRGYEKKNHDEKSVEAGKKLTPLLQDYYPERLFCFYVIGANWFYRFMFGLFRPFMSKKTADKMRMLEGNKDLLEFFDQEQLSVEYGGVPRGSKFKQPVENQENAAEDSEDETELKKLADKIYENNGMVPPKLEDGY